MPNRRTVSPEFFSWVHTRRLFSCQTCPVRSPSLCVQQTKKLPMSRKKRLGCYQQEQFSLLREYSVFDGSQCTVNYRKFKMRRRRESQINNSLTRQNNNFARASFCTFLCCQLHDYPWKCLISCFVMDVNKQWQKSFSSWTWICLNRNSAPEEFACTWESKRVGIITEKMWINFSIRRFRGCQHSLIFTQNVTDASVNTCCKLKLVFLEKRL